MCINCWEEGYDSAKIDTAVTRHAAKLIAGVYEYAGAGGRLHIAIDDFNLEDEDIEFCAREIKESIDAGLLDDPDEAEQLEAEKICCDYLSKMTTEERASALSLHDGFWSTP